MTTQKDHTILSTNYFKVTIQKVNEWRKYNMIMFKSIFKRKVLKALGTERHFVSLLGCYSARSAHHYHHHCLHHCISHFIICGLSLCDIYIVLHNFSDQTVPVALLFIVFQNLLRICCFFHSQTSIGARATLMCMAISAWLSKTSASHVDS